MSTRILSELDEDGIHYGFMATSLLLVVIDLLLGVFLGLIAVPKLKRPMEILFDSAVRNIISLQFITGLGFLNLKFTTKASRILRSFEDWVLIDYFDSQAEGVYTPDDITISTDSMDFYDKWTIYYFENVFSFTMLLIGFVGMYIAVKSVSMVKAFKDNPFIRFLELGFFLKFLQVAHFRLWTSFFLECRLLQDGKDSDKNTSIAFAYAIIFLLTLPIVKILLLRVKFRSNLENDTLRRVMGSDYREYRNKWREFHLYIEQCENIYLSAAIFMLYDWEDAQVFSVLGLSMSMLGYVVAIKPMRTQDGNIEETVCRGIRVGLTLIVSLIYTETSSDYQEICILTFVIAWFLAKFFFQAKRLHGTFKLVKSLLDTEEAPNDEEVTIKKSLEDEDPKSKPTRKSPQTPKDKSKSSPSYSTEKLKQSDSTRDQDQIQTGRRIQISYDDDILTESATPMKRDASPSRRNIPTPPRYPSRDRSPSRHELMVRVPSERSDGLRSKSRPRDEDVERDPEIDPRLHRRRRKRGSRK